MKTCKKALSIVLCLAVLIGTVALGLSVVALHPDSDLYTRDAIDQRDDYNFDDIFAYPAVELSKSGSTDPLPRTFSDFEPEDMDSFSLNLSPIFTLDSGQFVFDCYYLAFHKSLFEGLSIGTGYTMHTVTQCSAEAQEAYDAAVDSGNAAEISKQVDKLKYEKTYTSQQAQGFMTELGVGNLEDYEIVYLEASSSKYLAYILDPGTSLDDRIYLWEDGEPYLDSTGTVLFNIKADAPFGIAGKIGVVGADWLTRKARFSPTGTRIQSAIYSIPKTTISEHSLATFITTPKYIFNPNGGTFAPGVEVDANGNHSMVIEVGDVINLSTLAPTRADGVEFLGWKVGSEFYEPDATYTVTAENVVLQTFTAFWADGAVPIYMSRVPGFNTSGKIDYVDGTNYWVQVGTFYGNKGEVLTEAKLTEAINLVSNTATADPYDIDPEIAQQLGYTGSGLNITLSTAVATTGVPYPRIRHAEMDNFSDAAGRYGIGKFKYGAGNSLGTGEYNLTALYIVSEIKFETDVYYPNRNPDGTLANDGTLPEHYTLTQGVTSVNYRSGTNGRITSTIRVIELAALKDPNLKPETEKQSYKLSSLSNPTISNNPEISKNILNPAVTTRNVIVVYSVVTNKKFYIALDASISQPKYRFFDATFKIGDSVTYADVQNIGKYAQSGFNREATLQELMVSGARIESPGYCLTDLYFVNPVTGERTDFVVDGVPDETASFVYTSELNSYAMGDENWKVRAQQNSENVAETALFFNSVWKIQNYYFEVRYLNADSEATYLTSFTLQGNARVTLASVSQELRDMVAQDHPEGRVPGDYNIFMIDGELKPADCFASSYSSDPDNPTIIELIYKEDRRYAYVDYNNGQSAEEAASHTKYDTLKYGDLIYRPNWEPESPEDKKPPFNTYMDNFAPASNALREIAKDNDGDNIYEQLQRPVIGADGQPVTDANGVVLMENVYEDKLDAEGNPILDENGKPIPDYDKPVYDETKPVYVDEKGNTKERPYRNCEFVGYKMYEVKNEGNNYASFADLPARSTWTEISLNEEVRARNTPILQIQWKSDKDFFFRVYNGTKVELNIIGAFSGGKLIGQSGTSTIYSALGKDFKMYYWKDNKPCTKAEAVFNPNPENFFTLYLKFQMEEAEFENGEIKKLPIISAVQIGKEIFTDPMFIGKLIPTILGLLQSILSGKLAL